MLAVAAAGAWYAWRGSPAAPEERASAHAPVDGTVVLRNVEVGQAVVAGPLKEGDAVILGTTREE